MLLFSNIVEAGANIQIENCPALTTILLGALATVLYQTAVLPNAKQNPGCVKPGLFMVVQVEGRITVTNNGVLVNFDAGQLTTVTTGIEVRDNAQVRLNSTGRSAECDRM